MNFRVNQEKLPDSCFWLDDCCFGCPAAAWKVRITGAIGSIISLFACRSFIADVGDDEAVLWSILLELENHISLMHQ